MSRPLVAVLTGAGISTDSGIPDFRGPQGLRWQRSDVTSDADNNALCQLAVDEFGQLDGIICNTSTAGRNGNMPDVPLEEMDFALWQRALDVNLIGALRSGPFRAFLDEEAQPRVDRVRGHPVDATPVRGPQCLPRVERRAARGGRRARPRGGPFNVRVNTVVPGKMLGPTLLARYTERAAEQGVTAEAYIAEAAAPLALPRIPTDAECTGPALFLVSGLSAAMTGQSIDVNGGEYFHL